MHVGVQYDKNLCIGGQWEAYQRSIWNHHTADLAIDNSTTTCYISGYDIGAWWFVDLGLQRVVDSVIISGGFVESCTGRADRGL